MTAYRHPDRAAAKAPLTKIIGAIAKGVPAALTKLITLVTGSKVPCARRVGDVSERQRAGYSGWRSPVVLRPPSGHEHLLEAGVVDDAVDRKCCICGGPQRLRR